jgi:hypothetical protein
MSVYEEHDIDRTASATPPVGAIDRNAAFKNAFWLLHNELNVWNGCLVAQNLAQTSG